MFYLFSNILKHLTVLQQKDIDITGVFLIQIMIMHIIHFTMICSFDEVWNMILSYTHYLEGILSSHLTVAVMSRPSFLPPSNLLLLNTRQVRNHVALDILYEKIHHEFTPIFTIHTCDYRVFTSLILYFISFS